MDSNCRRSISFILCFTALFSITYCQEKNSCKFRDTNQNPLKEQLIGRLSSLYGKRIAVQADFKYSVALCTNASLDVNSSVTQQNGNESHTLGRFNDTDIIGADNWLLLSYGSGDLYNATERCNGLRKTNILILCNPDAHEPSIKYLEHSQVWKDGGCFFMFEMQTCAICPIHPDEGLSKGSVFCIIFLTSLGVYLVVGICYRRLVKGAKGFEQIPHHRFWTKLGNLQAATSEEVKQESCGCLQYQSQILSVLYSIDMARMPISPQMHVTPPRNPGTVLLYNCRKMLVDGCNFACRRQEEESWRRLTTDSRPKDISDDQDDALLRP